MDTSAFFSDPNSPPRSSKDLVRGSDRMMLYRLSPSFFSDPQGLDDQEVVVTGLTETGARMLDSFL